MIKTVTKKIAGVDVRMVLAFAAIYLLWGATFLAIRFAVAEIPPLFSAGVRFFVAGACLFIFMRFRGEPLPTRVEWRNLALVAICMFVVTYGPLFWAQQYVTSSITAVIEASLPITTVALEVFVFRKLILQPRLAAGVLLGFCGVAGLLIHNPGQQLAVVPCIVILGAGISWSFGTVLSGQLQLPASKALTAGGEMMIGGALLLILSALGGEMRPFPSITPRGALALGYLIIFGSLIAYTAYVWLLARMPATRVASHAYVNPIVAVALGYFFAGEIITPRTVVASILIVGSVFLILAKRGGGTTAGSPSRAVSRTTR